MGQRGCLEVESEVAGSLRRGGGKVVTRIGRGWGEGDLPLTRTIRSGDSTRGREWGTGIAAWWWPLIDSRRREE